MFELVTGRTTGNWKKSNQATEDATTIAFAVHPTGDLRRKERVLGRNKSGRPRRSSSAAGNAKESCCKTIPVPTNALNAVS